MLSWDEIGRLWKTPAPATGSAAPAGFSIDSRTVKPGELFFAVRGERLDGHEFVAKALEAGAAAAVVETASLARLPTELRDRLCAVDDPLAALQQLARAWRRAWGGLVVAVTGSAGKTTTKDMIAAALGARYRVLKNEGNLNNHFGLPLTLLRLSDTDEIAVVELGMNHAGEIARLAAIAEPNVGVFTNVGEAHVGNLGSIEGVAAAKRELATAIPADGLLVLNADDARVMRFGEGHAAARLSYGEAPGANIALESVPALQYAGRHYRSNAAAALAVAQHFGVEREAAGAALAGLTPGAGRGRVLQQGGVTWLDDTYNANPQAMRAMLAVLQATPAERRLAVLGEMRELGPLAQALHAELGREIAALTPSLAALYGVQGEARGMVEAARAAGFGGECEFFADAAACGAALGDARHRLRSGDAVLFKGSRGVHLETALAAAMAAAMAVVN